MTMTSSSISTVLSLKERRIPQKERRNTTVIPPLSDAEIGFLADERPDRVFIGTGQYGDLPVTPAAEVILQRYHTEILPFIDREQGKYVAVLHVTC
jgi:hypothetical protein